MSIDSKDVESIAHLARLHVDPEVIPEVAGSISDILAMIDQMQSVETDDVKPLSHAIGMQQRLRPDVVTETDQRDALQAIAPSTEQGLYLVPKVIE